MALCVAPPIFETILAPATTQKGEEEILQDATNFVASQVEGGGKKPKRMKAKKPMKATKKKSEKERKPQMKRPACKTEKKTEEAKEAKKKKKPEKEEKVEVGKDEVYSAHRYSELRTTYIKEQKDQGATHKAAVDAWDKGQIKKQVLGNLSLGELKRRRFVDKTAEANPWANEDVDWLA